MRINKFEQCAMYTLFAVWGGMSVQFACAEALNTQVPKQQEETFSVPVNIDIPQQPLANSLHALGKATGMSVSFPNDLVSGKTAPEVRGRMTRQEALRRMLNDTGLAPKIEGDSVYIQKALPKKEDKTVQLDKVEVRAKRFYEVGPLPGLGLTKEEIPGNVQSISAKEIKEAHALSITDLMNRKLQSVTVNDYQGNPFQMDVQYRGFTAGPQIGTPQGLSVFIDGIRVNEPFGDVVNWDMLPMNALASVDVFPGSNPIFGLNTLGGAFSLKTKDGFNNAGFDADILTGTFGRKQLQTEGGWNNGTVALFGAGNFFLEDGWREKSPSRVNQFFGKASYRGDKLDLNLSTLLVANDLTGNGLLPSEMYAQDRNSVFTSPDETKNRLTQFQLSSSFFVNDHFTVTGQIYRRNSKRHQKGADVMMDYDQELVARRRPNAGEESTCLFGSRNQLGLPDYVVVPVDNYDPVTNNINNTQFAQDFFNGTFDINNYTNLINNPNVNLPPDVIAAYRGVYEEYKNFREAVSYNRYHTPPVTSGPNDPTYFNEPTFNTSFISLVGGQFSGTGGILFTDDYFFTRNGNTITKNYIMLLPPVNEATCFYVPGLFDLADPVTGNPLLVDGFGNDGPGYVPGTPTALFTDNQINQIVNGASIQFNWNFEHHKFMVGASIDAADATYKNEQRLGFFDANRNGYLDPAQAHPMFVGAYQPLSNNNFEGTNNTKSIYFSETWSPVKSLNFNASARYNVTKAQNKIATRSGFFNYGIGDLIADPDVYNVCTDVDGDGDIDAIDCAGVPTSYRPLNLSRVLDPAETEKFSYHSLNPSFGATWQAKENLNIFANWAQGTRTPSVIELGCALDHRPSGVFFGDGQGGTYEVPLSLVQNRQCTLPSTLSGDPYLKQIKATTHDVGMRGSFDGWLGTERIDWNVGAYQTDLKDDIYFINVGNGQGFFDNVGKTRRRGLEAGLSGKTGKWGFGLNYSLTDATFQDSFLMTSNDNSSSFDAGVFGRVIRVEKGNRMPGVPLHNLNANVSYEITSQWRVSLNTVMHSESFVRGNENNEHKQGVQREVQLAATGGTRLLPPTRNPGTVAGYATFNFQTSYRLNTEWTASLIINNLFDKEYFSAGRLGRNAFSPSIFGAVGPDGYNHNSGDWLSTNFIAPAAPRGVWFSLNYQFDPKK